MKTIKLIVLGLSAVQLTSCMVFDDDAYSYQSASYNYNYNTSQYYPQVNYSIDTSLYGNQSTQQVVVPDSYHVGAYHSPVSFKDRDKTWVSGQNPNGYTIEVADDEKAAQVAQKLYKTPKNDRMAQIQYQQQGKAHYKGVYGSYDSPEAAQKALDALPAEVKQGAGIKKWESVQSNLSE